MGAVNKHEPYREEIQTHLLAFSCSKQAEDTDPTCSSLPKVYSAEAEYFYLNETLF